MTFGCDFWLEMGLGDRDGGGIWDWESGLLVVSFGCDFSVETFGFDFWL